MIFATMTAMPAMPIAIILCTPQSVPDKFYNWQTGGWENPFNAPVHLMPLQPMEGNSSSPFNAVLWVESPVSVTDWRGIVTLTALYTGTGSTLALTQILDVLPPARSDDRPMRLAWVPE
jgi:hypothetical protein